MPCRRSRAPQIRDPDRLAELFDGLDALRRLVARPEDGQQAPAALLEALETDHAVAAIASDTGSVLREAFANVVRQQCDALRAALERFEQDPEDAVAQDGFAGVLSTLQAAAAYAGRRDLQEIIGEGGRSPVRGAVAAAALLESLVAILAKDRPVPAGSALPETGVHRSTPHTDREPVAALSVRISAERIDKLVEQAGELSAMRSSLQRFIYSLESADLGDTVCTSGRALAFSLGHMIDELQRAALDLRLIQLGAILQRLPRVARDVATRTKKRVRVVMEGADTEIDKGVAEAIADPLLHMVRNAVDHGLEAPDERVSAGKDPEGLVLIRASRHGNFVVVSVEDDGRGIDPESVRRAAIAKGIISAEEADSLTVAGLHGLLFRPGFSTARTLTEISGRGVGLDVVRANVNRLGGDVTIASQTGSFTRVEMRLPACVSAQDVLLVQAAGDWYAIPLDAVRKSISVPAHNVRHARGHMFVVSNDELVSVRILTRPAGPP